jgi:hypothetical protein
MSFKLPSYPSPQAPAHELADYAEFVALLKKTCSARDVESYLGRINDNAYNIGIMDSDSENELLSDEMMLELSFREKACGGGYPFGLSDSGTLLKNQFDESQPRHWIYAYLLFATRLNMSSERQKAGINGTDLLERISACVLRQHLGGDRALSMVFGTSAGGSFPDKINTLCRDILEGGSFAHKDTGHVHANDDGLDVVGWIPFSDQKSSKLSVFGQCKSGTSWDDVKTELQPNAFINRWMSRSFAIDPLRALFVSESVDNSNWFGTAVYTGLLFDRCRIVDFAGKIDSSLAKDIVTWTKAAIADLESADWG